MVDAAHRPVYCGSHPYFGGHIFMGTGPAIWKTLEQLADNIYVRVAGTQPDPESIHMKFYFDDPGARFPQSGRHVHQITKDCNNRPCMSYYY